MVPNVPVTPAPASTFSSPAVVNGGQVVGQSAVLPPSWVGTESVLPSAPVSAWDRVVDEAIAEINLQVRDLLDQALESRLTVDVGAGAVTAEDRCPGLSSGVRVRVRLSSPLAHAPLPGMR